VEPKNADKNLTDILSTIDTAAEKLFDVHPDWEPSSTVHNGIRYMLHPYYEIMQDKRKTLKQLKLHSILMSSEQRPGLSSAK
jgi:hypothetical protein